MAGPKQFQRSHQPLQAGLGLLLLEGKASSLLFPASASPKLRQRQSKLGRESLFMAAASSRALKNGQWEEL